MTQTVQTDSLITLHYRLGLDSEQILMSTFDSTPATLKLGGGELAPTLERCLVGLAVGERQVFQLEPEQAFGLHNPNLVERMPREAFRDEAMLEEMSLIEFTAPDGNKLAGLLRELGDDYALIDFNHPLAGKAVRFEVQVIGIL